jgi:UDP-N-acetyl-D-mannosaminuronic acid dehydrogenase
MPALESTADVSVIGLGRIGLPLALSFADRGLRVIGVDNDATRLDAVRDGTMPFQESGAQDLLDRVHASDRLSLSERVADAAQARHIVITLGTPSFSHIEIDMRDIRSALDDLLGVLVPGHALTLRSTVAPGTTEFVAGYLAKHRGFEIGEDVFVAHVPERIAAGRFLEEIDTLPCIVGGVGARSGEVVAELFGVFRAPIVQTTPVQAELAKIWANILRYTNFALPNLLMMDCERHKANVFDVIDLINRDYPRGGIAQPGLTAGTCLRKDFAFSEERSHAPGMLLAVSRVNESVPLFLVEGIERRLGSLSARKVAVLGRRARLARPQADPAARARAGRRGRARPSRADADPLLLGSDRGRGCGRGGRRSLRVPRPTNARRDHRAGGRRLLGGGPLELLGRRPSVRLCI